MTGAFLMLCAWSTASSSTLAYESISVFVSFFWPWA